jgi:PAS domain S-box-containing protein
MFRLVLIVKVLGCYDGVILSGSCRQESATSKNFNHYIYYVHTECIHNAHWRPSGEDVQTITVLYVDDEPVMLDTLKLFLERDPEFRVIPVLSAKAALELLKTTSCDAIISDYEMPDLNGIEFLKIIRVRYPQLPFIIFTGKGREEIVIESLNNGADYYVRKGGEPRAQFAELSSKVKHAVELRESHAKIARLNRLYLVLSRINEAIVRIHDRRTLMEEVCKIAVQEGGFIRAYFGFEELETRKVTAMIASGTLDGFFTNVHESSEPCPEGKGLALTAIRRGQPSISNDILADPLMGTWAPEARTCGYRAAASFPITTCRKSRGAITFFSQYPGFFTGTEIDLLSELSEDISYALEMIDLESSRRNIQNELEQSRRQLVNIINFLPEPTFAIDCSGTLIIWNQAMEHLTDVSADEVIGKGNFEYSLHILGVRRPALLDLLTEDDGNLVRYGYTAIIRNHRTVKAEVVTIRKIHGAPAMLRLTASPLYDEKGQLAGAIESVQDITRMKKAEEEIAESREKYRLLLENVSDSIVVQGIAGDRPGPFIEVNDRACRMIGYTREEFLNLSISDIWVPGQEQRLPLIIAELFEKRHTEFKTGLVSKDGHAMPVEVSALMFNLNGTPVVLSIIRKTTKNRHTGHASAPV